MKTKTKILMALVAMAGSASMMAQTNVYSLNVVGYVNLTVAPGFSIIANPLNAATNSLSVLIPNAPENSVVFRFVGGVYQTSVFGQDDNGNLGWVPDFTIAPGEGFWLRNVGAQFTNTFVGEVLQGNLTNSVPSGFSLKASQVPVADTITALQYPANENDAVYLYRNGGYTLYSFGQDDNGNLVWSPSVPSPNVAEGFWIFNAGASKNWVRSFSANN